MSDIIKLIHGSIAQLTLDQGLISKIQNNINVISECESLDFKRDAPVSDVEYGKTIKDVVAFHNSYGGFIVFGVAEVEKDRCVEICGVPAGALQIGKLRDMLRMYVGKDIRVAINSINVGEKNLEVMAVSKRSSGEGPVKFIKNGPDSAPRKPIFKRGDVVFRRIESNANAESADDYAFLYSDRRPPSIDLEQAHERLSEPLENTLPDRSLVCAKFVGRSNDMKDLWEWLNDDFSRVRLIFSGGGFGKTSLAYRFSEEVAKRRVRPFNKVVWLSAKKKQFVPSENDFVENRRIDYCDPVSLYQAIILNLSGIKSDVEDKDVRELQQEALAVCAQLPAFIVIDDIDSLVSEDQRRVLEFGLTMPPGNKVIITTRVNFSYSPDNVLKLEGLRDEEFRSYIVSLRERYKLPLLPSGKISQVREVTSGSPLYTDSLLRLERRGLNLDTAISQWRNREGLDVRKAALEREIQQLSRNAKRLLFVISNLKNCSFTELKRIFQEYSEQTIGDALQELDGLFLVNVPPLASEPRYAIDPNTGALVLEIASTLHIDHSALIQNIRRINSDAIGKSIQRRKHIIGQAISQALVKIRDGDGKSALDAIRHAMKTLTKPDKDLVLAAGRCCLHLTSPAYSEACKYFAQSYEIGQRKPLLFNLWYQAELDRAEYDEALSVANKALQEEIDVPQWYERRANVRIQRAVCGNYKSSTDSIVREIDLAIPDLFLAMKYMESKIDKDRISKIISDAESIKVKVASGSFASV